MFDWDDENRVHIARHGVTPEEAEQVLANDPLDGGVQAHEGEDRVCRGRHDGCDANPCGDYNAARWIDQSCHGVPGAARGPEFLSCQEGRELAMIDDELKMPKFASEAEEAEWWFKNPDFVLEVLKRAKAEGRLGHGTVARRMAQQEAAKSTTIRLDTGDLALAKQQAERKGLRYQTYLKMLIHEALRREEQGEAR
jgi:hypothetical protein